MYAVLSITSDTTSSQSQHVAFCHLVEMMGLHFSGHILFPVLFSAQLRIGWLDAMVKGGRHMCQGTQSSLHELRKCLAG